MMAFIFVFNDCMHVNKGNPYRSDSSTAILLITVGSLKHTHRLAWICCEQNRSCTHFHRLSPPIEFTALSQLMDRQLWQHCFTGSTAAHFSVILSAMITLDRSGEWPFLRLTFLQGNPGGVKTYYAYLKHQATSGFGDAWMCLSLFCFFVVVVGFVLF